MNYFNNKIFKFGIFVFCSNLFFGSKTGYSLEENKVVIIFRYDDYYIINKKDDLSKLYIEKKILEIFNEYKVPLTIGVVPNSEPLGPNGL